MDSQENENFVIDSPIDDEIHIVVQSSNQVVNGNGRRKKLANFTIEEDLILVSAWLNTSMDAINGTDQKSKKFWTRISTLYTENNGPNYPKRSEISINNRWQTLQRAVNKFQGCFAQIDSRNSSGTNEDDTIIAAKEMYQSIHGENFVFQHCWNVLRSQPKWMLRNSLSSKKRVYSSCSPNTNDSVDLKDNSTPDKSFGYIERPIGRKAEKEALKKRKGKSNDGDMLADWKECKLEMQQNKIKMQEEKMKMFAIESEKNLKIEKEKIDLENKRLDLEAQKVELEAKKLRHQQVQQEMNIVLMDTSTLNEKQKEIIELLHAEILSRKFD